MPWELTSDLETFAGTAGEFLRARPVEHTVFLTLVDTLRRRGLSAYGPQAPVFGWWRTRPGGPVDGVLLQTPPHPMMVSAVPPEAVPAAAEALAGRPLSGANLLAGDAPAFTAAWGVPHRVHMRTRLYRLDRLI